MASSRPRATLATIVCLALPAVLPLDVLARDGGRFSGYTPRSSSSGTSHHSTRSSSRSSIKCGSCPRDNRGKIKWDANAVLDFKRAHPKPSGCDKCEVDHIVPLSKGGRDDPGNKQWLPKTQRQN